MATGSRRTRVLIAEDHRGTREALRALLERREFEVIAVDNGEDAAEILTSEDGPCIALLDWMLPGATGLEVCRTVRKKATGRYVYVIVITGRDGEENVAEALAAGADDFMHKPCGVVEVFARVRNGERTVKLERSLARRIVELEEAAKRTQQLKRLLPICMYCKKVRDDSDYWHEIEAYLRDSAGADFSHGICPHCMPAALEKLESSAKKLAPKTTKRLNTEAS